MEASNPIETPNETDSTDDEQVPARFAELQRLVSSMEKDFQKFFVQGNKAAGTRVRQAMQELKSFAQNVRAEVLALRNPTAKSEPSDPSDG
jgi:hypothetical protein